MFYLSVQITTAANSSRYILQMDIRSEAGCGRRRVVRIKCIGRRHQLIRILQE